MSDAAGSFDPVWEQLFQTREWGKYPAEHTVRFVARSFYDAPDRRAVRLLDLGSGPGAATWYMAREGFSVSAIDGSPSAIARLSQRLAGEGLHADARVGDIAKLPWPDEYFDGVIENAVLCCNPYRACRQIVNEVRRVLKPKGRVCSTNFTDRSWGYGAGPRMEAGGFSSVSEGPSAGKGYALFMSRAQVDELFSGFANVAVEMLSWTMEERRQQIELWNITAEK